MGGRQGARQVGLRKAMLLATGLTLSLAACRSSTEAPARPDQVLAALLDGQWRELGAQTTELAAQLGRLCQAPDPASLAASRTAWEQARRAWLEAQLYEVGGMTRQHLKAQLGWWPVNGERIDALIAGPQPLDAAFLLRQGSTVKGLYALETILWPADGDDAALLAAMQAGPRRCAYAAAAGGAMAEAWRRADAAWGSPATPLAAFPDQQAALNALVNRLVFVSQELDGTLGKALGKRAGGRTRPEELPGRLSEGTVRGLLDGLCGIRTVWEGRRAAPCADAAPAEASAAPGSLADLTASRSPEAAADVEQALDEAAAAVEALPEPLAELLAEDPAQVEATFQTLKALQRTLATQLVGALGVNLTFNANDGD